MTCDCQQDTFELEKSDRLLRYSNLGHLTRFTFDNLDTTGRSEDLENQRLFAKAFQASIDYAADPRGWFILTGDNGSGKTHLAAAIAHRRIQQGHVVLFVHVPDLLDHLRATYNPSSEDSYSDLFDQVRSTPLLVLDGLTEHRTNSWALEKLLQLLNHRYNAELPTIITTTCEIDELDPYIRSRVLAHSLNQVYELHAPDSKRIHKLGTSGSRNGSKNDLRYLPGAWQ